MASQTSESLDRYERIGRSLEERQEPGAAEVCDLVRRLLGDADASAQLELERLKTGVYRLRISGGPIRALVLKCLKPSIAQTDRLLAERWLPALGLGDRCPRIVAAGAQRDGCWVWHAYEDVGDETLRRAQHQRSHVEAAVDLIADIHVRAATHPLMPEIRWRARDYGVHYFTANLRDAIGAVEALAGVHPPQPPGFDQARARVLERLYELREDAPRRIQVMEQAAGPDTLLHGDLWPKNVFVTGNGDGLRAQLIDWDHVGAGPFSYDLSTFLYRAVPEERAWIVQCYRERLERAGWRLPPVPELNLLLHTAEVARQAHCILFVAIALLHDSAEWAPQELIYWDRYFAGLRPPLDE